jgi:lysophospholipase L1-like esterase
METPAMRNILPAFAIFTMLFVTARCDEPRSPVRWEKNIAAFEQKLKESPVADGSILFVGSSSIRFWDLATSFPDRATVNHGFGGSETSDSVHFFGRIVTPVAPSIIVMYAGDNDVAHGKTPAQIHADFLKFVALMQQNLRPDTQLHYIAIKPSLSRWNLREPMQQANNAIRKSCEGNSKLSFVDIWTPMLNEQGEPRPELFRDDELHLNEQGYALWNTVLTDSLSAAKRATGGVR